ncbi:MAG: pantetheine-phosphate adenylyltransferase [Deltaproteobacteria bacterium]|nr:pantetheine-phosphate adenylyltransferase [Deltaproteobacteria bacterium]|tara:strand:- start:102 stop:593 length:492 start_codon:yes stop_codon:yes gene_type:complete
MSERIALCPGSFDPVTNGHVGIIRRSLRLFDRVVVAVTVNPSKKSLFTLEERMQFIKESFPNEPRLSVQSLEGLLAIEASKLGAVALVRGLRASRDFEYELQMAHMNRHLTSQLETVFLATEASGSYVSSSLVCEVARLGGDISALVPAHVAKALTARLSGDH